MKKTFIQSVLLVLTLLAASDAVVAQPFTNTASATVNLAVPDNNGSGFSTNIIFSSAQIDAITDVNVTLNLSGGINGDLYGYLTYGSGFAVLLNRVGRALTNDMGYSDAGLNITVNDTAANGDVHTYQLTVNPGGAALTGIWAPDGRNVDPALVRDTDARTTFLSSFNGLNPNGTWTLFLADVSPGGITTLNSWGLEVVGVPEPGTWVLLALGGGLFFALRCRKSAR